MHRNASAWMLGLALLAPGASPASAKPGNIVACTGPADPAPCLLEEGEPDRSRLPTAGPAAWVSGDRLVISWVGEADQVAVEGSILVEGAMPRVAPGLFQHVIRYPRAQETRAQLRFAVERGGRTEHTRQAVVLAGPKAFVVPPYGDIEEQAIGFGAGQPQARVWLPPGYRAGLRYPTLYLADGGGTSPGALLADAIRKGELAPLIVVGVDYAPQDRLGSDLRLKTYVGARQGPLAAEFLAHERFLLDTVIPAIEARYGAPPERRLRAVGGASAGSVWAASMALRNPGVFGTAFVMSPGVRPAQHGQARPSSRFYVSAGELEPDFHWAAACLAGEIVERGGVASYRAYPSGHDLLMWVQILIDNARDWLAPQASAPVRAAPPVPGCRQRR